MRLLCNDFTKGLWTVSGKETTLKGFVRRNVGANELRTPSLRNRNGSVLRQSKNSIVYITDFANKIHFATSDGKIFKETTGTSSTQLISGLSGVGHLSSVRFPPTPGQNDYLFILGWDVAYKIDSSGGATNWGIFAPTSNPTLTDAGAGAMGAGTYQYYITFKNSVTGARSNPRNAAAPSITIAASHQVSLTNVPVSPDSQVDTREIFRTTANGARFFKIGEIANNSGTTFNDNINDTSASVQPIEIQFDNIPPAPDFQYTWGPYAQRIWWAESLSGSYSLGTVPQGRAYYSAPGRPEAMRGFIDVCTPSEGIQGGVLWNRRNWIITQQKFYLVDGDDEPFQAFPLDHVPGAIDRDSIVSTPMGIFYKSFDGVRLFDGNTSRLVGFDALATAFRLESIPGLAATLPYQSNGAAYYRGEYYLTFSGDTLALSVETETWRNLGKLFLLLYVTKQLSPQLLGVPSTNNDIYSIDDQYTLPTQDGSTNIPLEWEIGGAITDLAHRGTIQRVYVDIATNNQSLNVSIIIDGVTTLLGTVSTGARQIKTPEFPVGLPARVFSVLIEGTTNGRVELFGLGVDVKLEGAGDEVGNG